MKKLKCDSCGGKLKVDENGEYGTCQYCGSKFKLKDDVDVNINVNLNDSVKKTIEDNNKKRALTFIIPIFAVIVIMSSIITFGIIVSGGFGKDTFVNAKNNIVENLKNETLNKISDQDISNKVSEVTIKAFNSKFEIRSGSNYKTTIEFILDDVVTNNKTNKDQLITVIYQDKKTTNPDEIISIKHSLKDKLKYEVLLDYDSIGFVNKITIEEI